MFDPLFLLLPLLLPHDCRYSPFSPFSSLSANQAVKDETRQQDIQSVATSSGVKAKTSLWAKVSDDVGSSLLLLLLLRSFSLFSIHSHPGPIDSVARQEAAAAASVSAVSAKRDTWNNVSDDVGNSSPALSSFDSSLSSSLFPFPSSPLIGRSYRD